MKNDEDDLEKIAKLDVSLEAKDYIALAIAALETLFLPLANPGCYNSNPGVATTLTRA